MGERSEISELLKEDLDRVGIRISMGLMTVGGGVKKWEFFKIIF